MPRNRTLRAVLSTVLAFLALRWLYGGLDSRQPPQRSLSAIELRRYLRDNMPTEVALPRKHPDAQPGSQSPSSQSGRTLYALATHPALNTILVYFMGYPGANGVYCLAKGLQHKHQRTGVKGTIITADVNAKSVHRFQRLLRNEHLLQYVDVRHQDVNINSPIYRGKVDMFAEDMDGSTPLEMLDFVLQTCRPKVYVGENTRGIGANHAFKRDYGAEINTDHVAVRQADSLLDGVKGRGFSVYTRPYDMLFADIRSRHRQKDAASGLAGCLRPLTASEQHKLVDSYIGWGHETTSLAKHWNCSRESVWDLVTCASRTLCGSGCRERCS